MNIDNIMELLGDEASTLLEYKPKFPKENLQIPGSDFIIMS